MEPVFFYIFAVLTAGLSVVVVLQPQPVAAAIALVGAFFGIAAIFVLLEAHFLAAMQILLYAGAIMVFFVFVVMLLNLDEKRFRWRAVSGSRVLTGSAALYLAALLALVLWSSTREPALAGMARPVEGSIEDVGMLLLSKYVVPFEVLSVVLLVAIIGAVVLGKKHL